jgi:hypothetical protein
MDLDRYLEMQGLHPEHLIEAANTVLPIQHGDTLLAAGSLVEGIGTVKSDIDLLLIVQDESRLSHEDFEIGLLARGCLIDLRVLAISKIASLVDRLGRASKGVWDITHPVEFNLEERMLLHRIHHGRILNGSSSRQDSSSLIPIDSLSRLKLQASRQLARTIQVDMAGFADASDYASLVFCSQELLGCAVDAIASVFRLTNPGAKWRHRLMSRVPQSWSERLPLSYGDRKADDLYWHLHRAPIEPTMDTAISHGLRTCTFARAIFIWAEADLVHNLHTLTTKRAPTRTSCATGTQLPHLDYDVDFRIADGKAAVSRLNSSTRHLDLTIDELSCLALFDGETDVDDADNMLSLPCGSARELCLRLSHAGLANEHRIQ